MKGNVQTYTLQLLQDTAMQILVHVPILQRILRRLVRARQAGVQVLQQPCKADPHLEGVHPHACRVPVAAVGDGNVGRCYRGCIWRKCERAIVDVVVAPGRMRVRVRGRSEESFEAAVSLVGGHFSGVGGS